MKNYFHPYKKTKYLQYLQYVTSLQPEIWHSLVLEYYVITLEIHTFKEYQTKRKPLDHHMPLRIAS